jgi:hypothetical protein
MTGAGYSGTPLMKKLGAKPGMAALYIGVPEAIEPLWSLAEWGRRDVVERPPSRTDAKGGPYGSASRGGPPGFRSTGELRACALRRS